MYLISTHRLHVYKYAYYPAGKKNTQLLTSLHHETNETMSDGEEWNNGYVENHDNDDLSDTEEVDAMEKKKEVSCVQKVRLTIKYVNWAART